MSPPVLSGLIIPFLFFSLNPCSLLSIYSRSIGPPTPERQENSAADSAIEPGGGMSFVFTLLILIVFLPIYYFADYTFAGMLEPYLSNLPAKTPSPDSYLRLLDTVRSTSETPLPSNFQIFAPMFSYRFYLFCSFRSF